MTSKVSLKLTSRITLRAHRALDFGYSPQGPHLHTHTYTHTHTHTERERERERESLGRAKWSNRFSENCFNGWQYLDNFITSQGKRIDKIYKRLVDSNSMSKETWKQLKPVETRPGIMYGSCEAHKKSVQCGPPFRPILFALQTPTYKLA